MFCGNSHTVKKLLLILGHAKNESAFGGTMARQNGGSIMRIKIQEVGKGLHPSEVVVQVAAVERPERLIVDRRSIDNNTIEVGYPIAKSNGYLLVELPRETVGGTWRVWITKDIVAGEIFEGVA
jgi:hypothetical protein